MDTRNQAFGAPCLQGRGVGLSSGRRSLTANVWVNDVHVVLRVRLEAHFGCGARAKHVVIAGEAFIPPSSPDSQSSRGLLAVGSEDELAEKL